LGDKALKMTMKLDQHDKVELVKELIGIAASDGHFHDDELKWIMVFSVSLDLDPDEVKNEILENIEIVSNEISKSTEVIDKVMKGLKSDLIKTVKDYDEVEGYTGKKIDHPELTENNIMFEKYLNNEYKDYFNFNKIIEEMVNILGSDVYQTLAKNAAFVMNDEDEIDQNLPCTEEQLRKNFLQINNIILKSSVLVSVTEKIEPSEIIDYVIFNNKSEKLDDKIENATMDPTSFAALQVMINYEPHNKNNGVYDIFDEGMIDKGLLNSSISIFSLFLEGSNRPTDQKLKDSIADFLDTFGYGLYLKEEFKAAVIIHNKSIELSPDNSSVAEHLTNKGKALLKLGNIEDAKKDFEKAIEKDENFEEAKKALSSLSDLFKNQVPKVDTKKLYELNNKASELLSESKFDEAIKNYSMVLELMPKSNLWGSGGIVYAIPEDIMNGVIMSEVYFKRGKCHYAVNNYELAIIDFNNCIRESKGENVDATYNIGSIKFSQGEFMEALKNFNKVISLDNNYYQAYYMRATCHVSSDNPNRSYEKALSDVNKFISFEPDDKAANQFKSAIEGGGKKIVESDGIKIDIGANQQQKEKLLETFNQINDLMKINKEMGSVEGEVDDLERAIEKIDFAISIYNIEKPYGLGDRKFSLPHLYYMRVQCQLQLESDDMNQIVEDLKQVIIISNGNYIPDEGLGSMLFYSIKEKINFN